MLVSIVTPSFRNSAWLRLCLASVADQQGVDCEHIVQDAGSDDGTLDWLPHDPRVRACVETDTGMYDGVNRGLRKARGEILAYLNCDEQYLPGALRTVQDFFTAHPTVDVVFAWTIIVNAAGKFICYRKMVVPHRRHTQVCHLSTFTCATFFRRRVLDQHGLFFDPHWRDSGDAEWVVRLLERRVPLAVLPHYTSAFTDTGENRQLKPNAARERQQMFQAAPAWARAGRRGIQAWHFARRAWHGCYSQQPFSYSIYTLPQPAQRTQFDVAQPRFFWKERF